MPDSLPPIPHDQFVSLSAAMLTTCETCRYAAPTAGYQTHQCRRGAPSVAISPGRPALTVWPLVASGDWCGEHLPKDSTS